MRTTPAAISICLAFLLGLVFRDIFSSSPQPTAPALTAETQPAAAAAAPPAAAAPAAAPARPLDRTPQQDSERIPVANSPSLGPAYAPVTIVEFSDYQCPFCRNVEFTLHRLREQYGDQLRIVWKNNPIAQLHPNAPGAAEAVAEAFAQGGNEKFWRLHELLFQHQDALDRPGLERFAQQVGLDMPRFRRAMDAHTHQAAVEADRALLARIGGRGTPNFYVNGRNFRGEQSFEILAGAIDAALARARAVQPPSRAYAQGVIDAFTAAANGERTEDPAAVYNVPIGNSPVLGPSTALITVVVFSDFQCPFCGRAEATLASLRTRYGNDIRFVWKNEPLAFHENARPAAQLAMEAFAQGGHARFWRAHDLLFQHSTALGRQELIGYGRELGLDAARVLTALNNNTHNDAINADHALAAQLGVSGTPAFYINGRRIVGARPEEAFVSLCDEVRRQAQETLRTAPGATRENLYERIIANGATSLAYIGGGAAPAP
ncbi:MAG: thioredoxin domain-containing protein [Deltaproteobacteria bacterium]|jgi:protein-disulfide isomerase|nr:thioredoxin domain-containing protein [Deltaproteobacteria bacterium]MBK7068480.1 thioredoxin domain-containing protein [Deltaproteobacteria bacterium]MBK8692580.1 thioredoxin domain-containing protein [Deltaproteobacteria bacterium]MBP6832352.1 thioredoxin domain-containing protein [Deltaproteobacteria bacterium]